MSQPDFMSQTAQLRALFVQSRMKQYADRSGGLKHGPQAQGNFVGPIDPS